MKEVPMNVKSVLFTAMVVCLCSQSGVSANQKARMFRSSEVNSAASANQSNIALSGTAYGWSRMTSSTANTGKVARSGINDDNLTTDVDLQPDGERPGAWEAAGVIWKSPVTVTSVDFINGKITRDGDGFLTANCMLQFSKDGTTWTNSGWTLSP